MKNFAKTSNPLIEYFNIQGIQKELLVYNEIKKQSEEDPSDRDLSVLIREMEKPDVTLVEVESELGKGSHFMIKLPALSHQGSRNV